MNAIVAAIFEHERKYHGAWKSQYSNDPTTLKPETNGTIADTDPRYCHHNRKPHQCPDCTKEQYDMDAGADKVMAQAWKEPKDMSVYEGLLCEFGWLRSKIDRLEKWTSGNAFRSESEGLYWSECHPTPEAECIVLMRQAVEHTYVMGGMVTRADLVACLAPLEEVKSNE